MKQFVISEREAGQRMDKYVCKVLGAAPRGFIYKMLRKKNIVLNDRKASGSEILQPDDVIKIYLADETFAKFAPGFSAACGDHPGNLGVLESPDTAHVGRLFPKMQSDCAGKSEQLEVVYEDEDILVINKPAGMLSQKAKPGDVSANEYVIAYLLQSGQLTEAELRTFRPSICNRLDRNTSGLLAAGKTIHGLQEMAELFKTRAVKKFYRALVVGEVTKPQYLTGYLTKNRRTNQVEIHSDDGNLTGDIPECHRGDRAEARPAGTGDYIETSYVPVAHFGGGTLLEVHLITGRSHQIRAHLSSIGHPVLGDPKYGDRGINRRLQKETGIRRQILHAYRMEFPDGRVITADVPEDFSVAEDWLNNNLTGKEP